MLHVIQVPEKAPKTEKTAEWTGKWSTDLNSSVASSTLNANQTFETPNDYHVIITKVSKKVIDIDGKVHLDHKI